MLQHVYEKASLCSELDQLLVATDSKEIKEKVLKWGGRVCMTSSECSSGTERIIEVREKLSGFDHYINIQGE